MSLTCASPPIQIEQVSEICGSPFKPEIVEPYKSEATFYAELCRSDEALKPWKEPDILPMNRGRFYARNPAAAH